MADGCNKIVMGEKCSGLCPGNVCFLVKNDKHETIAEYLEEYKDDSTRLKTLYYNLTIGDLFDMRDCVKKEE